MNLIKKNRQAMEKRRKSQDNKKSPELRDGFSCRKIK